MHHKAAGDWGVFRLRFCLEKISMNAIFGNFFHGLKVHISYFEIVKMSRTSQKALNVRDNIK